MLDDLGFEDRRRAPAREIKSRRKKKKKRRGGRNFLALLFSLLMLAVLGGGVYWGLGKLQEQFATQDYTDDPRLVEVLFVVQSGDSCSALATRLVEKKVVMSAEAFLDASAAAPEKCQALQPGTFKLWEEMPAAAALAILGDPGNAINNSVTIVEGLMMFDVFKRLSEASGIPVTEFDALKDKPTELGVDPSWFSREGNAPTAGTVEGFLFPDTYVIDPTMDAKAILTMMVERFNDIEATVKFKETVNATRGGITPYEALIVASLAQAEGHEQDFGKVARVAYNRVYVEEMPLEFDSTANYWARLNGGVGRSSAEMDPAFMNDPNSPYNTKSVLGLPLGPIGNPGQKALQAAMSPEAGPWIFFVTINSQTGETLFAETLGEHCDNIEIAITNGVLNSGSRC